MIAIPEPGLIGVCLATALSCGLLARLARRFAWTDAPSATSAARKLQRAPVPAVGGAALLIGLALAPESAWKPGVLAPLAQHWPAPASLALSLAAVFAVGMLDDRLPGGLAAGPKFLLQLAALSPLGIAAWSSEDSRGAALASLLVLGGLVALNALNTFDNADGALASLAATGFLFAEPAVTAACLGFLPLNLDAGRRRNRARGAPSAYLGDAGSLALGFLALATPRAWGVLWVPLLDLARLSVVRTRAGSRPWIGDRAHLAHRLAARGLSPRAVAAAQAGIAFPACLLVSLAQDSGRPAWAWAGLAASGLLFVVAVVLTEAPSPPCGERSASALPPE